MVRPAFTKPIKQQPRGGPTVAATLREFGGGWNVADSDLNLAPRFAKKQINLMRSLDGSIQVRWGTKLLKDLSGASLLNGGTIVDCFYFNGRIVTVGTNGKVLITAADGTSTVQSTAWGATTFVSFTLFNNELIICNGVNKPLLMKSDYTTDFLVDLATVSNVNTPIGLYCTTHNQYMVIAGDPSNVSRLYISNKATSGTFAGDPAPNDAINFELGSFINEGDAIITGLGSFRDQLVVSTRDAIVLITLGLYDGATHVPKVNDVIPANGAVCHRTITGLGQDMHFADIIGIAAISRALFTGQIQPDRVSRLVDPAFQKTINPLGNTTLSTRIFSVYNRRDSQVMHFLPNNDVAASTTETRGFVHTYNKSQKISAFHDFRNWNWVAACRTSEGRVVFATTTKLYFYGNTDNPYNGDYTGEYEGFSDDTMFTDGTGLSPASSANVGLPIPFIWEFPWADMKSRTSSKMARGIGFDTTGMGRFTCAMFVDNLVYNYSLDATYYYDGLEMLDGYGDTSAQMQPSAQMAFIGGDYRGFGVNALTQWFGDARPTRDERLYVWNSKYNIMKLRLSGTTSKQLKFVTIKFHYELGTVMR